MTEQTDAEKAAEEYAQSLTRVEPARFTRSDIELAFYSGAAWAAQHKYVSSNGKTSDSKSENEGSIPSACAITMQPFRAWLAFTKDLKPFYLTCALTRAGCESNLASCLNPYHDTASLVLERAFAQGYNIREVEVREVEK